MKLAIYTAATESYAYALPAQARRVIANIRAETRIEEKDILITIVTNDEACAAEALAIYRNTLTAATIECLVEPSLASGQENYKENAQLLIAQMRTLATLRAQAWDADFCWSLDSDVLPPHNALRCMLDMLEFDRGYYGVSFCPYPSQGGGAFLGGRGTVHNPILPDFYEEEQILPDGLLERRETLEQLLKKPDFAVARAELSENWQHGKLPEAAEELKEMLREIQEIIRHAPPKQNIFEANGKRWRKRGWFDNAYPALGKGAIVPVDWTGCGCTLMGREALALCDWCGYEGRGTEDLYINYHKWQAHGIRICCIPHCPCDHVVRHRSEKEKLVHIVSYHEPMGEHEGHLRQRTIPWYTGLPGEKTNPGNDGVLYGPRPSREKKEAEEKASKEETEKSASEIS